MTFLKILAGQLKLPLDLANNSNHDFAELVVLLAMLLCGNYRCCIPFS
jgi:hypothetical protein